MIVETGKRRIGLVGNRRSQRLEEAAFRGVGKHDLFLGKRAVSPEQRRLLQMRACA